MGITEVNARVKLNRTKEKLQQIIKTTVMNFDKLQEQWKSEPQNIPETPKELDKIKEAHNPIDKVRSNMKKELIVQSVLIIAVAFFLF